MIDFPYLLHMRGGATGGATVAKLGRLGGAHAPTYPSQGRRGADPQGICGPSHP